MRRMEMGLVPHLEMLAHGSGVPRLVTQPGQAYHGVAGVELAILLDVRVLPLRLLVER